MPVLYNKYLNRCRTPSDINEHLPTLYEYAKKCKHVTEAGVRTAVSSYAFGAGLVGQEGNKLVQIDLNDSAEIQVFLKDCASEGVNAMFYKQSDLDAPMEQTDLFFIDTWHVYGHLKRELARWHSYVSKYIILHDTTLDEIYGETIRNGWDAQSQSFASGIPVDEITKGLWPAVTEFLTDHPEWTLEKRYTNNNGLTILRRVSS